MVWRGGRRGGLRGCLDITLRRSERAFGSTGGVLVAAGGSTDGGPVAGDGLTGAALAADGLIGGVLVAAGGSTVGKQRY